MGSELPRLGEAALRRFDALRAAAVEAVAGRFDGGGTGLDEGRTERARAACREDLAFTLEFLRPVLEFGLVQPMDDYLRWLASVLAARAIPLQHVEHSLMWVSEFYDTRLPQEEAHGVRSAIELALARLREPEPGPDVLESPVEWPACSALEASLLAGDRRAAGEIFESCRAQGHGIVETEVYLLQPSLHAIGRKWQDNLVSVAQEHLATAIAQAVMARAMLGATIPASNGAKVVLACVEGNHHCVGLQMVADGFLLAGWDVEYLGANVPTTALIHHAAQSRPALIGLSVSFAQQLRVVKEILSGLENSQGAARPRVIIGGLAVNRFNGIAGGLGADAWASNALEAVSVLAAGASASAS